LASRICVSHSSVMADEVLYATSVDLLQCDRATGRYDPRGQVGAAVTSNPRTSQYKLVCHEKQQMYICTATITSNNAASLKYVCQTDNYGTGKNYGSSRDDNGDFWNIYFTDEQDALMSVQNIALAVYGAGGMPTHSITSMDASEERAEVDTVHIGDSVGVKFTSFCVGCESVPKLGHQYDGNIQSKHTYEFTIPHSNTALEPSMKGFEGAVCGMRANSRRLLIVPPACRGTCSGARYGTLLFMVEVRKVQ